MTTQLAILISLGAVAILALYRLFYWYREGQKLQIDGYLPPHPTIFGQTALRLISRVMTRLYVGPVKVYHRANARFNGRLHILPNHQFPLDFMVIGRALPYGFRHLGTAGEMRGALRGTLSAFAGFFAIHTEKGKATGKGGGEKAVNAMALALARHPKSRVLTFPQGQLVKENVLRPDDFRTGAIRAMQVAVKEHGVDPRTLAVLPMAVHYMRDRRARTWMHFLFNMLGWKSFRTFKMWGEVTKNYGAVVVIGKPITMAELPDDPRLAIEQVRVADNELLAEAKALAGYSA